MDTQYTKRVYFKMGTHNVGDSNFWMWLVGIFLSFWGLITKWQSARITDAHKKIEEDRRDNGRRFENAHKEIEFNNDKMHDCRQQLYTDLDKLSRTLMTEAQVKDFVDRSIRPIEKSINAVHTDIKLLIAEKTK